jgi:16S rRNA (adenine1518-N6/adenine1519-N6)-dimethyltransferase
VRDQLVHAGVRPSKRRGQTFLVDASVARRQVEAAGVSRGEAVLEVGGGLGVLTKELSGQGARVRVIELEEALVRHLEELDLPGVTVEQGDALKAAIGSEAKVVANLPYSISTPMVERLVRCGPPVMVLMLQREFADRLVAHPGSKAWSRLGAVVQREYAVEMLEDVPPHAFSPQPKVHSAVVRLTRRKRAGGALPEDYGFLVGRLFAARRKKVRNTVAGAAAHFGVPPADAVEAAERLGFGDRRPEELSCDDFGALCDALASRRTHK